MTPSCLSGPRPPFRDDAALGACAPSILLSTGARHDDVSSPTSTTCTGTHLPVATTCRPFGIPPHASTCSAVRPSPTAARSPCARVVRRRRTASCARAPSCSGGSSSTTTARDTAVAHACRRRCAARRSPMPASRGPASWCGVTTACRPRSRIVRSSRAARRRLHAGAVVRPLPTLGALGHVAGGAAAGPSRSPAEDGAWVWPRVEPSARASAAWDLTRRRRAGCRRRGRARALVIGSAAGVAT